MKKNLFLLLTCSWYSLNMSADNLPMKNDVIWFDKPIPSSVPPVWEYFDNLIVAGAKAQKNKDIYWENLSLPIGNGNGSFTTAGEFRIKNGIGDNDVTCTIIVIGLGIS